MSADPPGQLPFIEIGPLVAGAGDVAVLHGANLFHEPADLGPTVLAHLDAVTGGYVSSKVARGFPVLHAEVAPDPPA